MIRTGGVDMLTAVETQQVARPDDEMRVPFWIVLAGVGSGAFWSLLGVLVGYRIARTRR